MTLSLPLNAGLARRPGRRRPRKAVPIRVCSFLLVAGLWSVPAGAEGPAVPVGGGFTLRPLVDARLRYEHVDQEGLPEQADALTVRMRTGLEAAIVSGFSLLAEAEATLPIVADYDSGTNRRTAFPIVADPANVELNRLQLRYRRDQALTATLGRQRIELDDQRFVGSVGWRQNEQTFDAVRLEARPGPFSLDLSYAWSVRTIFGVTAQELPPGSANRQSIHGDNVFAGAGVTLGPVQARAFAYLVDQDEDGRRQFSSQSYGLRATAALPLGPARLNLAASYARQSDHAGNPRDFSADYLALEAGSTLSDFTVTAGYELLGADDGAPFTSFQTPLATLHRFNGWADKFLVTPPDGLRDLWFTLAHTFAELPMLPGLQASVTWHGFRSDRLGRDYGSEWDAQLGFRIRRARLLVKYADYRADGFATDTRKFWLQLEWSL